LRLISDDFFKFGDMIVESNRGNHFRTFEIKEEAEKWLLE